MARARRRVSGEPLRLSFPVSFDVEYTGLVKVALRDGGEPFTWWEKALIWLSFKFGRPSSAQERKALTPARILSHLATVVMGCVDREALQSFRDALDEMVDYHRLLADIHMSEDDEGNPLDFAELGSFASLDTPHSEWIRLYRRIFQRATRKIDVESDFMRVLSHLPARLLPSDAAQMSGAMVDSILSLAAHEVVFLEKWFAGRPKAILSQEVDQPLPGQVLLGLDEQGYKEVLVEFVGAWERVGQKADQIYGWRESRRGPADDSWAQFAQSLPFLQRHLKLSAYLVASAVWNDDRLGADKYRDLLVRWSWTVRHEDNEDSFTRFKWLLLPTDIPKDWNSLAGRLSAHLSAIGIEAIDPGTLFTSVLRQLHRDVLTYTSAVMLGWYIADPQTSKLAAQTARQIFFGEAARDGSAERRGARDDRQFRGVMRTILRGEIGPRDAYGGFLDGVVSTLEGMTRELLVAGRIYTGWGWPDRGALTFPLLAILVTTLPAQGDEGVLEELEKIASDYRLLPEGDLSLIGIIQELTRLADLLKDPIRHEDIKRAASVLSSNDVDIASSVQRLLTIFGDCISAIEKQRILRMQTAPLDRVRLNEVRLKFEQTLMAQTTWVPFFADVDLSAAAHDIPVQTLRVISIRRGELTDPRVSQSHSSDFDVWDNEFRRGMLHYIIGLMLKRPNTEVELSEQDTEGYWRVISEQAGKVGQEPILLASATRINETWGWVHEPAKQPNSVQTIVRDVRYPITEEMGYVATINGIAVYLGADENEAFLFSGRALRAVSYRPVDLIGHLIKVDVEDTGNPQAAVLTAALALEPQWDGSPTLQILFKPEPKPRTRTIRDSRKKPQQ